MHLATGDKVWVEKYLGGDIKVPWTLHAVAKSVEQSSQVWILQIHSNSG
jgi:hypothetical protein